MSFSLAARYPLINEILTQRLSWVVCFAVALVFAPSAVMFAHMVATSDNLVTRYGPVVGGDFIVFHTAAKAAISGNAQAIYDSADFAARLKAAFPGAGDLSLFWQYPPTMFAVVAAFGLLPYLASYAAWATAGGALYLAALRPVLSNWLALFCVIGSPAVMQALATGQTGFVTAGLLMLAASNAERRPILAGLAAGILTFKPQLGFLLPIAFIACGAWRAFAVAALTALALFAATTLAFGSEIWTTFFSALAGSSERLQSDVYPFQKLVSVYGGLAVLGAPLSAAMAAHISAALGLAGLTFWLWRRRTAPDLKIAALAAAALLATPNTFYYEMTLTLPALLAVARRGAADGWLPGERPLIAAIWLGPTFTLSFDGLPLGFLIALAALALVLRRALRLERPA